MKQKELERKLEKEREDSAEESTIIVDTQESTIIVDTQEETLVKSQVVYLLNMVEQSDNKSQNLNQLINFYQQYYLVNHQN